MRKVWKKTGDHLFVAMTAYWFSKPKRGDIVVFRTDGIDGISPAQRASFISSALSAFLKTASPWKWIDCASMESHSKSRPSSRRSTVLLF